MDITGNFGLALILTAIAGLSTGIGSAIAYFFKRLKIQFTFFTRSFRM